MGARLSPCSTFALLGLLPFLATAVANPAAAAETQPVRLSFASTFPGNMTLIGEGAHQLSAKVSRASGGEVVFDFHEPGALVPAAQTLHAVSRGEVDAGWGGAGWFSGVDTAFNMF